ncbi:inositol 2-dehydrogenase [Egibacter rhizosphaerae]|uniref:Inositol 2-dehydrogenase n=1 Tax=Egibacter rhizosphaerae TaxID=1670831 RepID=A0A411YE75_9ACTN|nr:Gfo/Idh/MocA family oxidoreductase [Egibacter rhizosphaerae]QBI19501.1 inositol 2-dehydrogenase [Egibacter rhizosphaerae]
MSLRLGILGAGRIGGLHAANAAHAVPGVSLEIVADPDEAARSRLVDELGTAVTPRWEDVVGDERVDALVVASPTDLHAEQVRAAADAGTPVLCEKPLDTDLAVIDELLGRVARRGTLLMTGFNRRFDPHLATLRDRVARELGDIWQVRVTSRDPAPPPTEYAARAGGLLVDMTIHDFDTVRFVTGSEITEVSAWGTARMPETPTGEADTATTLLRLTDGAIATIENCRRSALGYDQRVEVHGEGGTAFMDNVEPTSVRVGDGDGLHRAPPPPFFVERYAAAYRAELAAFRDAVTGGPAQPSGWDGRQAVAAALAGQRALTEGRPVRLDEFAPAT